MDESTISQQLASNLNQPQTDPAEPRQPDLEPADPDALHNSLPLDDMVTRYQIMDYLDLGKGMRTSPEIRQKIDTVMKWAKENAEAFDINSLLSVISHQESTMGSRFAEDRLQRLYMYVRLNTQRLQTEQQIRTLYGSVV